VHFIDFPRSECADVNLRDQPFDPLPYRRELDVLWGRFGRRLGTLVTEPYLGGGGSYHPPHGYVQLLQGFCREHDLLFILDEVQSNFGRTGELFAFVKYGIEPDLVVLGKGLANGIPVAAAVGPAQVFARLAYGVGSDTWSGNPLSCAGVLATLDSFEDDGLLGQTRAVSAIIESGLVRLKELPFVRHVRGERGGMVWGVECQAYRGHDPQEMACAAVLAAYQGAPPDGQGVHLLGPLAGNVLRIAPPLTITAEQARESVELLYCLLRTLE
jgi:4-aminobutyrate aminotransferase-like enzyme